MNKINAEIWRCPQPPAGHQLNDFFYEVIVDYIKCGILLPGQRLPAYRAVAELNKIFPTSMQRIYYRLEINNWLVMLKGSGTFVSEKFPGYEQINADAGGVEHLPIKIMPPDPEELEGTPHFHDFMTIGPDMPSPHFSKYWVHLYRTKNYSDLFKLNSQVSWIEAMSSTKFKLAILDYLNLNRNFQISERHLEVIVGRRECLEQVFAALLRPMDIVVNTSPKDRKLCGILKKHMAVTAEIIVIDDDFLKNLKNLLSTTTIKALYIRPQVSYPEGYSLSTEMCMALLELARQHNFYIVEEDDYHEYWFDRIPFRELVCQDHKGHVIYCGALSTLSVYMQQTRTIVAPAEFISLMQHKQIVHSTLREVMAEAVITDMLVSNKLAAAVKKMRQTVKANWYNACMQMDDALGSMVKMHKPSGGLAIWLTFCNEACLTEAIQYIEKKGFSIPYAPGSKRPGKGIVHIRLCFGTWDVDEARVPANALSEKFSSIG